MKILITAFTPMGDWKQNSSELLLQSLISEPPPSGTAALHFALITTDCSTIETQLLSLLDQHQPDICLFTGQARTRNKITIERFALNYLNFTHPDAAGNRVSGQPIDPEGPLAYAADLPNQEQIVPALLSRGIPAANSNHAGTSLCNQLLYLALHRRNDRPYTAGFIHLPVLPEQTIEEWKESASMSLEMMREAIAAAVEITLGRDNGERVF